MRPILHCSFCGLSQHKVYKLIASPTKKDIFICNECIQLCLSILTEETTR